MKFFFIIFLFLFPSLVIGNDNNVYYCSETKTVGFFQSQNNKFSYLKEDRFKVSINFDKKLIKSESLYFEPIFKSECFSKREFLSCTNEWGTSFVINRKTLDFKKSFLPVNDGDSLLLSYGKCERF